MLSIESPINLNDSALKSDGTSNFRQLESVNPPISAANTNDINGVPKTYTSTDDSVDQTAQASDTDNVDDQMKDIIFQIVFMKIASIIKNIASDLKW